MIQGEGVEPTEPCGFSAPRKDTRSCSQPRPLQTFHQFEGYRKSGRLWVHTEKVRGENTQLTNWELVYLESFMCFAEGKAFPGRGVEGEAALQVINLSSWKKIAETSFQGKMLSFKKINGNVKRRDLKAGHLQVPCRGPPVFPHPACQVQLSPWGHLVSGSCHPEWLTLSGPWSYTQGICVGSGLGGLLVVMELLVTHTKF